MTDNDRQWMRRCLDLARKGAGRVSPNPMVGSVIVKDGASVGEGYHTAFGGAHAEPEAIQAAASRGGKDILDGSTLYVNLEPCNHQGKTPPCTDAILRTGISRVVVGTPDPFPAVAGSGISRLRTAGIEVEVGVLRSECVDLNRPYFHHVNTGRPYVTLKQAQSLDGFVATESGESRWISSHESLRRVHVWRSEYDAVLIGSGTAIADDPKLTVRHVDGRQPLRIVIDSKGKLPASLLLFTDDHVAQTVAVIGPTAAPAYATFLENAGGGLLRVGLRNGRIDLIQLFELLGNSPPIGTDAKGIQSVLVECGPGLATALAEADLIDEYRLFVAPVVFGTGVPTFSASRGRTPGEAMHFDETTWEQIGTDILFTGRKALPD